MTTGPLWDKRGEANELKPPGKYRRGRTGSQQADAGASALNSLFLKHAIHEVQRVGERQVIIRTLAIQHPQKVKRWVGIKKTSVTCTSWFLLVFSHAVKQAISQSQKYMFPWRWPDCTIHSCSQPSWEKKSNFLNWPGGWGHMSNYIPEIPSRNLTCSWVLLWYSLNPLSWVAITFS